MMPARARSRDPRGPGWQLMVGLAMTGLANGVADAMTAAALQWAREHEEIVFQRAGCRPEPTITLTA